MPTALLALWNDVDPAFEAAYEDWHAREHVPERLTVPGMCWALRWARVEAGDVVRPSADGAGAAVAEWPRYLTLYAMRDAAVVDSEAYLRLLSHPTPASRAMRPALRRVTRWICSLDADDGIGRFDFIAGRTVAGAVARPAAAAGGARLLATRKPDAAALPWLGNAQGAEIVGDRLELTASGASVSMPPGAVAYRQLPVG